MPIDRSGGRQAENMPQPSRLILAESFGAGALTFAIVASGILAERFWIDEALIARAITALTGAGSFFMLFLLLHKDTPTFFNPAGALIAALKQDLPFIHAFTLATGQIASAFLAAMLAHLALDTGIVQTAGAIHRSTLVWMSELAATALFLFLMLQTAKRHALRTAFTGFVLLAGIAMLTPALSFANPAITLARALTDSFTSIQLSDAFIIANLQAIAAIAAWRILANRQPTQP